MDLQFTEQQMAFREEVRAFLRQELPPDWQGGLWLLKTKEGQAVINSFNKKVAARGWVGIQWPKEYGGLGAGPIESLILDEEMGYHRAPLYIDLNSWVGGTIIVLGTEEQQKKYIPGIASCNTQICIGYTEPEAGCDLFALKTRAIEEADCYVINGQKMFTSSAHKANYCWLAARTDPSARSYKGLSIFMVDMKTPGITVRPLYDIADVHHLNEVFFDNVRVPKDCLIGEKNQGLMPIITELNMERAASGGGMYNVASAKRNLEDLVEQVKGTQDSRIRNKLAKLAVEIEIARIMAYNIAWLATKGILPQKEPTIAKLFGGEMSQRLAQTAMEIAGLKGLLMRSSSDSNSHGRLADLYLYSLHYTIAAGTSEIMRNLIAMELGLPRG
jgi:3-oxocholest-4-en-26-oyl-CoA dehydrogenase alpha subunit